ncbi:VIT1/CCC1 transporter family protein [Sphaerobacter thermophilus]|uniref:VIT1/CCC1 transporter family protein n=1 Tax=Sphaerobacter thermophilus TaxID=2057 RepID=UPI0039C15936
MTAADIERYRRNLQAEIEGVALYRTLSEVEPSPELATVYARLAETEERHAAYWRDKLREAGATGPEPGIGWRTRLLMWLGRRFGPALVLPTVIGNEQSDSHKYDTQPDARGAGLAADERSHARLFRMIGRVTPSGVPGSAIAQFEGRHRAAGGNALRAAVLGANDGLVSNVSLVMGVAGADLAPRSILVTGLAGLLAGSLSMAMGEWLSVQSARELYEHQIAVEREELEAFPDEEIEELTLIFRSRGMDEAAARALAQRMTGDPAVALDTLAREELGINPEELGGSAWEAAISSFLLFAIGAIIPVFPYFFTGGLTAVGISLALTAVALFLIGAGITVITGRNALYSGLRQVAIGSAAALITFAIGRLVGVSMIG